MENLGHLIWRASWACTGPSSRRPARRLVHLQLGCASPAGYYGTWKNVSVTSPFDDSYRLGLENQQTMELARRHCLKMEFVESGGRGMLEEATGLPINTRQVRCPVALGSMAMNLRWIASDFVRENCVGCTLRESTGEVPNLATVVADQDAEAAEEEKAEADRLKVRITQRRNRQESRNSLAVNSVDVIAVALADLSYLDPDPAEPADPAQVDAALARLNALADKAPEQFTTDFVTHAANLVVSSDVAATILEVLRRVSFSRPEFAPHAIRAALAELRRRASLAAARCIADLAAHVDPAELDDDVCRSAVQLAGSVSDLRYGPRRSKQAHDPTALRTIADAAPERLARVLTELFPAARPRGLLLPTPPPPADPGARYMTVAAAGAARVLASTHPELAASVVPYLVRHLTDEPDVRFHDEPDRSSIERTLAVFIVLDVGSVLDALREAGSHATGDAGNRLVRVLSLAVDLTLGEPRWREPGDPRPSKERQGKLVEVLFDEAVARLGGDWGDSPRSDAAEILKDIAVDRPEYALGRLSGLIGAFLELLESWKKPAESLLEVTEPSPEMQLLEQMNRQTRFSTAIYKTLEAVETLAGADPLTVCRVLVQFIQDESDTERGTDARWYLIKSLGRIVTRHGDQPQVVQAVLPTLHTHMVGSDIALQIEALDAWTSIGAKHALPSSLNDLLPAFTTDNRVGIARALARAAVRLQWRQEELVILLQNALQLLHGVDPADQTAAVKEAVSALKGIARRLESESVRESIEKNILKAVDSLAAYDLRDVLNRSGDWMKAVSTSGDMAILRLRQAADPQINDRWNISDDEELCDLLACGPGLLMLATDDLMQAGRALGPDYSVAAIEFAEVAWRAGRTADALELLNAFYVDTPDQPSHAVQRQILELFIAAAAVELAASRGTTWDGHARDAVGRAEALAASVTDDFGARIAASVNASVQVRRALTAAGRAAGSDPGAQLATQADELSAAGKSLAEASSQATPTGSYLRAFAAACEVAAHLTRSEAAALDARTADRDAHYEAAKRRAALVAADLRMSFTDDDPAAGPLLAQLNAVDRFTPGAPTAALLDNWATFPLPVPIVTGPRRRRIPVALRARQAESKEPAEGGLSTVAVVLASLDGRLITGPEVLRDSRVYDLSLRVLTGEWPEWAERLDAELITRLTPAEITVPEFTWKKHEHTEDGETYQQAGPVVLRFALAAGQSAVPLMLHLTWRGRIDGTPMSQRLDVSGHRELRLRPYDESRDRATNSPVFDERLLALYDRLARAGYDDHQLQAFCRLMTSICRAGLSMTWERRYRRGTKVTEKQFHDELHKRLVADPELAGRVERGRPLALGYLDVRHDGITAELKVERKVPVTRISTPKYVGQPTQYAAADGARLSILTILDMSPKVLPIGTPENYLFTLEPKQHGLTNPEAPSLVVVLVVNGNLPTPSSWSRRKTPVAGTGM